MPNERIEAIDVLRGFAIFGVLVAYTVWNLGSPSFETYGALDRVLQFLLGVLVDSKAYTLLAFLFGLGFSIQLTRAREQGKKIVPVYCRRLLVLMLFGGAHALLLRNGDILVPYAAMGFVLLLFRKASDKTIVIAAIFSAFIPMIARALWHLSGVPFPARPDTDGMGYFAANFAWIRHWYATAVFLWPLSLPMFFAGLLVGRRKIFENISSYKKGLRRVLIAGLFGGVGIFACRLVILGLTERNDNPAAFVNGVLILSWSAHAWGLAAFYAAALLLLLQRWRIQKLLFPAAALGRMALTNYLLQSIFIVPVCIAFDLFDTVTPTRGLLMAFAVISILVPFSVLWLRRFRFGPAEWLWRSLAYGKAQPMRITTSITEQSSTDAGSRVAAIS